MKRLDLAAAAACLLVLAAPSARGIEPRKTEGIVYRLQSFAAQEYATVYSPPQADTIYLIADTDNAFDPRSTLVYYWPLTREYFESWESLDVAVEGRLEVLSGSRIVLTTGRTEVVFSYPNAIAEGLSVLLAGDSAAAARAAFEERRTAYDRGVEQYSMKMLEYRRALRDYMRSSSRAPAVGPMPKEPVEPAPPDQFVSDPLSAFVVRLPPGEYSLRVVDARGNVVEGSERKVVSFQARGPRGTGYEVIPEERWTARVRSESAEASLFCMPGKELYVIPYETESYRQDQLARLRDPQSSETSRRTVRVFTAPRPAGSLVARASGRPPVSVQRTAWYVKQKPGAELGYEIMTWSTEVAGSDGPTFTAYRLRFDAADAGSAWRLTMEAADAGGTVPGSERSLRVINPGSGSLPWLFIAVPVIAGASVVIWRKRK